jgi:hypothetical protein
MVKKIALVSPPRPRLRRIVLQVALLSVVAMGAGCYPRVAPPPAAVSGDHVTSASSRWPGVTASSLAQGHDLFLANCNQCHGYPDLSAIADDRWPGILDKMGRKAHLDPAETDAVLHFVLASRAEQGAR